MGAIGLHGGSRRMREISLFVTFLFFLFVSLIRLQVATVDRFSRSICQTTRFRARKCLLGVSMMNFHIYSPFLLKIGKFALRPMATSNGNNSAIFKDRRKMFAPKWEFSGSGNLTASSKFSLQPTLVTMVTNWWFSNIKLAKTQLIQEIELRILHQTGGFRGPGWASVLY